MFRYKNYMSTFQKKTAFALRVCLPISQKRIIVENLHFMFVLNVHLESDKKLLVKVVQLQVAKC